MHAKQYALNMFKKKVLCETEKMSVWNRKFEGQCIEMKEKIINIVQTFQSAEPYQ